MNSADFSNLSVEPSALRELTPEQKERLTDVLDQYLSALESGLPPQADKLLAEHPDLAGPLEVYLNQLQELHQMAAGFGQPLRESPASAAPPVGHERLGDFVLLREVGRGGMGVVYEAQQLSLDRRVALKVLPFAAVLDGKQIARFKHEAQAAAQLHHPNIVSVFAVGAERGVHYYAMEYIDGQPLDVAVRQLRGQMREVRRRGRAAGECGTTPAGSTQHSLLTPGAPNTAEYFRTVAQLGVQAAGALHCAHEHGIVHRDVKPSNLLLDHEGKLWVTDFGLARVQTDATLTKTGDMLGTMRYMSPEQAAGRSVLVDHRTDVYSLGMTLYELLTLCPAFRDGAGAALLRRIEQDDPPRPRQLNADVPPDLENVVWKAIAKSRDERYATAAELADDLQRFVDGRPTVAKPPRLLERAHKWVRRHRRVVAAAVAGGAAALCLLVVAALLVLKKDAEKQAALEAAQRNLQRAEANFHQARGVVDQFGAWLAERLAGIPGAEPLRREWLDKTLRYYEGFIDQAADDPALQADIAVTYSKIGGITERIGKHDEALAAYRRSVAILERRVQQDPGSREAAALLALCRSNLGLLLARCGQAEEGQNEIAEARALQERLVARFPADADCAAALALTHNNQGLLYSQSGAADQAEEAYLAAAKTQRALLRERPDDDRLWRQLAGTLSNLSLVHSGRQLATAVAHAEEVLEIRQRLAKAIPDNPELLNELALAFNNVGALAAREKQRGRAAECYGEAIRIQSRLVELAPAVVNYRGDLAVSYNNLGLLQSQEEQYPQSLDAFRHALGIQQELVARSPDDPDSLSRLAGVYNNQGMVLLRQSENAKAVEAFGLAVRHQEEACRRAPAVVRYREFLGKHRVNLERAQREAGQGPATAAAVRPSAQDRLSGP